MKKTLFFSLLFLSFWSINAQGQCLGVSSTSEAGTSGTYDHIEDKALDAFFYKEVANIMTRFQIAKLDFYFYTETNGINAYARNVPGSIKEVCFGERLTSHFKEKFGDKYRYAITAVIAHELAHVKQFEKHNKSFPLSGFQQELQADFIAGYLVGYRYAIEMASKTEAETFFDTFYSLGDTAFGDEGHHGTHEQRKAASMAGWEYGKELFPIDGAYDKGIEVVRTYKKQG
jgi:hypothetical protein